MGVRLTHWIPAQVLRELHQLQKAVTPNLRRRPLVLQVAEIVIHRHLVRRGVHLRLHGRILQVRLRLLGLGLLLGLLPLRLGLRLLLLLLLLPLLLILRRRRRPRRLRRCPLPPRVRGRPHLDLCLRRLWRLLPGVLGLLGLRALSLVLLSLPGRLGLHRRGRDLRLLVLEVLELLRRHLHGLARRIAGHHVLVLRLRLLVLLHRHPLRHQCLRETHVSTGHLEV